MDLTTFYALVSGTCFTLLGLWWSVVEKHPQWRAGARERRFAGGVYLSFLLPATMSLVAQINPTRPLFWRSAFVVAALAGLASLGRLPTGAAGVGGDEAAGWRRPTRWVVAALYAVVGLLGAWPEAAGLVGLAPLEAGAVALVGLILAAHALTWGFVMAVPAPTAEPGPGIGGE